MRANRRSQRDWRSNLAGLLLFLTVTLSSLGAMWLPAYLVERVLEADETIAEEMMLQERWPGRYRTPMEYRFVVDGREFSGTPFMSEQAMVMDYEENTVRGVVVRSLRRPAYHRLEPVLHVGGFSLVRLFPYWVAGCALLALGAAALACHEHVVRFRQGRASLAGDGGVIAVNLLSGPLLVALPIFSFSAFQAFSGEYDFYARLGWPFTVSAVGLLAALVALGAAGRFCERLAARDNAASAGVPENLF